MIQDDDNIALITHDIENVPDTIEVLENDGKKIVAHATRKDIYIDYSPPYVSTPTPPGYNGNTLPPGSPVPPYDPNSPPYSAVLGRVLTQEEYNKTYQPHLNGPQTPTNSPPYAPDGSPIYYSNTPPMPNTPSYSPNGSPVYNPNNVGYHVDTPDSPNEVVPPPPSGSPPNSVENTNINTNYTPGTPIMITPMVPTQKLNDVRSEETGVPQDTNVQSEKKKVSYSSIINDITNDKEVLNDNVPILSTIEKEKEKDESKEKLKSINL